MALLDFDESVVNDKTKRRIFLMRSLLAGPIRFKASVFFFIFYANYQIKAKCNRFKSLEPLSGGK